MRVKKRVQKIKKKYRRITLSVDSQILEQRVAGQRKKKKKKEVDVLLDLVTSISITLPCQRLRIGGYLWPSIYYLVLMKTGVVRSRVSDS